MPHPPLRLPVFLAALATTLVAPPTSAQQTYFKAFPNGSGDWFAWSVAVSGDIVAAGAREEDSKATGVNGDPTDNSKGGSGAAYVFARSGGAWSTQAYVKASNTDAGDSFGYAVALSGETLAVGARSEASAAAGVGGAQGDNSMPGAGAVYVFTRSGGTWTQQAYVKAAQPGGSDQFGTAVALSGDTLVVGAPFEASAATGVNGNDADDSASGAGAAWVFVRNGATWTQQAYLKASNTDAGDRFGTAVAIDGDTLVVGALHESSAATGVDGDQASNVKSNAGAAYVFVRNGTTWTQQAYLKASNPDANDEFGAAVAVSGGSVIVGAAMEDSNAAGIDGNQASNALSGSGAAYVFTRSGTTWTQQAYLKASNPGATDRFGVSVALSGDTALVGAYLEDSAATGLDGDQASNAAVDAGAAYLFSRSGATWTQASYLKATNTGADDRFGWAVALDGDTALVGAYAEDSNAAGVDGDGSNNAASSAGAAYASGTGGGLGSWTNLGFGLAGAGGVPVLTGTGTLVFGSPGSIALTGAAPSAFSILFVALAEMPTPFKGGLLVAVPPIFQLPLTTDAGGTWLVPWASWPLGGPSGFVLIFQDAIVDAGAPAGVALSNALRATLP